MHSAAEIRERWTYLRDLLIEQLKRLEDGLLQVHAGDLSVSPAATSEVATP